MKKVVVCGLGAVGLSFISWCKNKSCFELKILANKERIDKYKKNKPVFNNIEQNFDYITPEDIYKADLIVITTKAQGLSSAISYIKNCVKKNTIIISLINGISSEEIIKEAYPNANVVKSYFIGHSAVRKGNSVSQDGVSTIVIEPCRELEDFFTKVGLNYSVSNNIDYSMWLKYTFNIFSNQTSAVLKMTFGEMRKNENFIEFAKKIIAEVRRIAEKRGITNLENLETDALNSLKLMCEDGQTSMLQDILAKRPTEADIFAGEIIKLGKLYGIETPYNQVLYDLIKIEEEHNEHCIHTC